jgi:ATP-dependent helicase/nuclease subunit A
MKNETPFIPPELGGQLTPKEADTLLSAGIELAKKFLASPLGAAAKKDPSPKNEYAFRSLYGKTFINGTIDLLFEDSNTVTVVDFKTDSIEQAAEHTAQMAFYYRAAEDLLGSIKKKDCRVWLYYLRSGHAVEMTKAAQAFLIEDCIKQQL